MTSLISPPTRLTNTSSYHIMSCITSFCHVLSPSLECRCTTWSDCILCDGHIWLQSCFVFLFLVLPHNRCRLRLLKMERIKDYLMMEEEFIQNQERLKPQVEKNMVFVVVLIFA